MVCFCSLEKNLMSTSSHCSLSLELYEAINKDLSKRAVEFLVADILTGDIPIEWYIKLEESASSHRVVTNARIIINLATKEQEKV